MTQYFNMEVLIADFPSIMASKDHPGFYEMKGGSQKFEPQRVDFVRQLFDLFPVRLIWLKGADEDLKKSLGVPVSTAGEACLWMLSDATSLTKLLNNLYEGGWAIFFLRNFPQHVPTTPELLPTKPDEVRLLLHTLSASVGILSWYDDIEWLVVSPIRQN